jgi:hypothetical protein
VFQGGGCPTRKPSLSLAHNYYEWHLKFASIHGLLQSWQNQEHPSFVDWRPKNTSSFLLSGHVNKTDNEPGISNFLCIVRFNIKLLAREKKWKHMFTRIARCTKDSYQSIYMKNFLKEVLGIPHSLALLRKARHFELWFRLISPLNYLGEILLFMISVSEHSSDGHLGISRS